MLLDIKNLNVSIEDKGENKQILKNLCLQVEQGETAVIMGPNGSGKSTLAQVLMGNPMYTVNSGEVTFDGEDLFEMETNERAVAGIFLSFQYPSEVTGVSISNFLRLIYNKKHNEKLSPARFRKVLKEKMEILDMNESYMTRYLNEGFSGGEKKKMEMLQMLVLEPKLAILDETDSGLDIDALKFVGKAVNYLKEKGMTVLLITHYTRVLQHIEPDKVHILQQGKISQTGGNKLANELEEKGYSPFGE